jgi:hypothetical protein
MSKDPSDPRFDLSITQLFGEGMVGTTWPQIDPYGYLSLTKWLNPVTEEGPQEVCARQPSSQQLLNDLTQGLYPTEVPLDHIVPPVGLGAEVTTHEDEERRISVVPHKESYSSPHVRRTRR